MNKPVQITLGEPFADFVPMLHEKSDALRHLDPSA